MYPSTNRAWPAEAPGAADAVQVGLWVVVAAFLDRHVELNHERHRGHVDAPREHVGSDEEAGSARAKVVQHLQGVPLCVAGCAAGSREGWMGWMGWMGCWGTGVHGAQVVMQKAQGGGQGVQRERASTGV